MDKKDILARLHTEAAVPGITQTDKVKRPLPDLQNFHEMDSSGQEPATEKR